MKPRNTTLSRACLTLAISVGVAFAPRAAAAQQRPTVATLDGRVSPALRARLALLTDSASNARLPVVWRHPVVGAAAINQFARYCCIVEFGTLATSKTLGAGRRVAMGWILRPEWFGPCLSG